MIGSSAFCSASPYQIKKPSLLELYWYLHLVIVFPSWLWYMSIISKREMFVKEQKVISKQTYIDYVAWMTQSNYPNRMILNEQEWNRQISSLPSTSVASARKRERRQERPL